MKKYKYSVLCFIVNGYEKVREVQEPDPDVEYVLVTDDRDLKSSTWRVVYDSELEKMTPFERCCNIKYNVFKYVTSDLCIYLDASIQVKGSLDDMVEDFNASKSDIGLMCHPFIQNYVSELQLWIKQREYPVEHANRFMEFLHKMQYNLEYKSHFQSGMSIRKKSKMTRDFENLVLAHLYQQNQRSVWSFQIQSSMTRKCSCFLCSVCSLTSCRYASMAQMKHVTQTFTLTLACQTVLSASMKRKNATT